MTFSSDPFNIKTMMLDKLPSDLTSVETALVAGALLIIALSKFPKISGRVQRDRCRSHGESEIISMRWVKLANGDGSLVARSSLSKEVNEDIMLSRASFSSDITTVPDYDHPDESNLPSMRTAFVAGLLLIVALLEFPIMEFPLQDIPNLTSYSLLLPFVIATIIPGHLHAWSGRILRWPVLILTYLMIVLELILYTLVRLFIRLAETIFSTRKHRLLRMLLTEAKSYDEWLTIANELDSSMGRDIWQHTVDDDTSYNYNWIFINELIKDLRQSREDDNNILALTVLRQCVRKNVGGTMNEDLFSVTNTGEPKMIVKEFLDEVVMTLRWLTQKSRLNKEIILNVNITPYDESSKVIRDHIVQESASIVHNLYSHTNNTIKQSDGEVDLPRHISSQNLEEREKIKTFLKRSRAAYGRTALCLSGGGMMGCYHYGIVKALFEENILPHIVSGTSAGSIIASLVCTRTDEEIRRDLKPDILIDKKCFSTSWSDRLYNVVNKGCLFEKEELLKLIEWFTCGDLTFEEAYEKTGRILCITVSATTKKAPPVLLNYINAPNVTIASAIVASSAVPGFIKPVVLMKKGHDGVVRAQGENKDEAYWDGSIDQDIPKNGLAEMFNCQFFLVSQCNPHIVPFFHNSKGYVAQPSRWTRGVTQDSWRGGYLLAALEMYLKSDMKAKFVFLNQLEAAISFTGTIMSQQQYTGTTTIVPKVSLSDYFVLFSDPTSSYLNKCFQVGSIAAYRHCSMIKYHYRVVHVLDECLALLEEEDGSLT